ncbi:hypothetical protein C8255_12515 [filamentous cyanobacterium CCP3]|nr:hypothetical protein C8255_12515 [filamentous cyanobacterium CCP3]
MIAKSKEVHYIHEPFNINKTLGLGCCRAKFPYWYTRVCLENEHLYFSAINDTLNFRYNALTALQNIAHPFQIRDVIKDYLQFRSSKFQKLRPLLKDPLALFSAEWLSLKFNADILVLIRHPAAFVSSIKRKHWEFPFDHFLKQTSLMESLPEYLQLEVKDYTETPQDIIHQASLVWKICHFQISQYIIQYPEWLFLKHENLSLSQGKRKKNRTVTC